MVRKGLIKTLGNENQVINDSFLDETETETLSNPSNEQIDAAIRNRNKVLGREAKRRGEQPGQGEWGELELERGEYIDGERGEIKNTTKPLSNL